MLRQQIQELLEIHTEPKEAAIRICILLEDLIGLEGNGWFDDDEELIERFKAHWQQETAEADD
jgi:hypothetical protein